VLRTHNGSGFCSIEFDKFCKENGIEINMTTPCTLQWNGVAEWMNRMLMERSKSILSGSNLQKNSWAKEFSTTCYLINRSPTSV
jgi:transposase InsO family protein